jgi:hypothetical protein
MQAFYFGFAGGMESGLSSTKSWPWSLCTAWMKAFRSSRRSLGISGNKKFKCREKFKTFALEEYVELKAA